MTTKIEWATNPDGTPGETWNPTRGCKAVSDGCRFCYAQRMAHRFSGAGKPYEGLTKLTSGGPKWTGEVRFIPEMLDKPLHWRKSRTVFVDSMSDLFHNAITDEQIAAVFGVMAAAQNHGFIALTKRAKRMRQWFGRNIRAPSGHIVENLLAAQNYGLNVFDDLGDTPAGPWPLSNVILGVSVEDRRQLGRIDELRATPAAKRVISFEPLIADVGKINLDKISWVIVGGEAGPKARPMHPNWARSIRDQCVATQTHFWFKQWGEWATPAAFAGDHKPPSGPVKPMFMRDDGAVSAQPLSITLGDEPAEGEELQHTWIKAARVGKQAAGRELDGRTWVQRP